MHAKRMRIFFVICVFFTLWSSWLFAKAAEPYEIVTAPISNNGKKWRIGYLEGGPYHDYQSLLKAFIENLAEMGWIQKQPFPQIQDDTETQTVWTWLATEVQSDYLEFVPDAYWSAGWDLDARKKNREMIINRLNTQQDIDVMLAFGTHAGQDLANTLHSTPTMVFSSSDPIRAGIVKSAADSGYDHLHAQLDLTRYERQIRLFHSIVGFRILGIAFQDTPDGRTYAAFEDVKKVAREEGFDVLECAYPRQEAYSQEEFNRLLACHQSLAPQIDAFYLTEQTGMTLKNLPPLLKPFFKYKVATFAQGRTFEVRYGVLLSLAQQNFRRIGEFHAEIFARILHGAKPRDLPQVFADPQEIAVNLETARKIGFDFPLDVLAGAREIYERIDD